MEMFEHNTSTFIGKGGVEIFFQNWKKTSPDGIIIVVHGIGEHSGRYRHLLEHMQDLNVSVYALDHRGHGKSAGRRGHVESFIDYIYDLKLFRNYIEEENENIPVYMMGHSMGGVIAMRYALEYPDDIKGLMLSAPALIPAVNAPSWKKTLGNICSAGIGSLTLSNGLDHTLLSHDSDEITDYENDPLIHNRISARLFTELMKAAEECLTRVSEITVPLLLLHGKEDKIANPAGSEKIYQNASSIVKEYYIFDGLYHEIINETKEDRDRVLTLLTGWLSKQLAVKTPQGRKGKKPGFKVAPASPKKKVKRGQKPVIKKSEKKMAEEKKVATKKASTKKATTKKAAAKKAAGKKAAGKKAAAKKSTTKKAAAKKGRKKA